MVKKETTGERPGNYSSWHRTLPDKCYSCDIDWVEYRGGLVKALIETSEINYTYVSDGEDPYLKTMWYVLRRTWFQRKVLYEIAKKLDIKAFIVVHEPESNPKNFLLLEITTELNSFNWKISDFQDINKINPLMLSEEDYRKFLINL